MTCEVMEEHAARRYASVLFPADEETIEIVAQMERERPLAASRVLSEVRPEPRA